MPDLNVDFTLDNDQAILNDTKDLIQSLNRLFSTRKGSVPFNRNYGTSLYTLLFENSNQINQVDVGLMLYRDLTAQEPRAYINPYGVNLTKVNPYTYQITLNVYNNETGISFPYSIQINKDSAE
jgi:phage baseplate assembly protein W